MNTVDNMYPCGQIICFYNYISVGFLDPTVTMFRLQGSMDVTFILVKINVYSTFTRY